MRYVIVGNGVAGNAAVQAILRRDPGAEVSIVSSEAYPFYSRVLISYYISGAVSREDVFLEAAAGRPGVRTILGRKVVSVLPREHRVTLSDGETLVYDRLLLATGGSPVVPDVPGADLPGVFTLRTLDDAAAIRDWASGVRSAVVLGGGMVGLKAAEALFALGLKVTVVASSARVLSQSLDSDSSGIVQKYLEKAGVSLRLGSDPAEILGRGRVEYVRLKSREMIVAGMVVAGKGIRPNASLAEACGITTNRGVLVDEFLQTSAAGIYAAGDVCEAHDPVTGGGAVNALWTVAARQGGIAGHNMAGGCRSHDGSSAENSFRFGQLSVTSIGRPAGGEGCEVLSRLDSGGYRRVVLRDGRIVGAVEAGEGHSIGILRTRLASPGTRLHTKTLAEAFVRGNLSFAHVVLGAGGAGIGLAGGESRKP
ncbi:MAG: NAD(P)/FAD-dependent oxidoreductase [Bacillota bacterium]